MGVRDGSLFMVPMGLESNNFGFFIRMSLFSCVFVKFRISVFMSLECIDLDEGWLRSQVWR